VQQRHLPASGCSHSDSFSPIDGNDLSAAGILSCVTIFRIARSAVIAAAGAVVTLVQLNLPSKLFWTHLIAIQWCCVAIVALYTSYEAAQTANQAVRYRSIAEYEKNLRAAMSATVTSIVTSFSTPWDEVAVYCYRSHKFLWRERLAFVGGMRAGAAPADIDPYFLSGAGLVGMAFTREEVIAVNWREIVTSAFINGKVKWNERKPERRYNMNWGQLQRNWGQLQRSPRLDGMAASPVFNVDGRTIGCVVVSGPLKVSDLESEAMRKVFSDIAATLDELGAPPSGWRRMHG
jgi:hypothetical protein